MLHLLAPLPSGERSRGASRAGEGAVQRSILEAVGIIPVPLPPRRPDAARREYVDLVAAGIIDPTKVVRIGLENAVSVASVLLLSEVIMTEIPESKREHRPEPEMSM